MRIARAVAVLAAIIASAVVPVAGQGLDRVEELVRLGRTADARTVLDEWWSGARAQAPQRDLQRGLWLRGRLTQDPNIAELDFQRLVVLYPSSPYAPQALLRLAQSAHAHGDAAAAERHVAAIVRDYPASPVRQEAEAWLRQAGPPPATTAARPPASAPTGGDPATGRASPPGPGATSTQPATTQTTTAPAQPPAPTTQPSTPPATTAPGQPQPGIREPTPRPPAPADAVLDWSVQFGAFTDADRAFALHQQLVTAGLAARLVRVAGSGFLHVRIGRFATRAEASEQLQRVTAEGYTAAIVRDDRAEELVRR
ncbi:MAG: SPOR domain-containing protein [Gemmatimonadales bacterium]